MAAVAKRLVPGAAAAAEGDSGVLPDEPPVGVDDLQSTAHEERPVRPRLNCRLRRGLLLLPAVEAGADYLVVGRPITGAPDPARAAAAILAEMRA